MSGIPAGAGQLLGKRLGKFEILALLALGGTAEIYLARIGGAAGFEKYVVVKCLHDHLADDTEFVKMFLDEARLAAHLDHSNIVQTMELGQHEGRYYMVMEFLAGLSLAMIIRRVGERLPTSRLPVPLVLNVLAQSCAGLHYAHEKAASGRALNIVHRDISPQNLVISFEGVVKVVDFGIAKAEMRETHTRSGTIKGKFAYMSPEQCVANNVDRRTDVFALGVIGHELLTGRRLFKRPSPYETYQSVIECDVKPPSTVHPELDAELDAVIMRALAKDKTERYPTAEAFGDALLGHLHHRGIGSGPGDVSRFFDAHFGQEIEEHSTRMRELISGREISMETGVTWGADEGDEERAAELAGDGLAGDSPRTTLGAPPGLSGLLDELGSGSRSDDDDEMPAERTRIESNPLDRISELDRVVSSTPQRRPRSKKLPRIDKPEQAAQAAQAAQGRPIASGPLGATGKPAVTPKPVVGIASGPIAAAPIARPSLPGMPQSGRFPDLANLPTQIAPEAAPELASTATAILPAMPGFANAQGGQGPPTVPPAASSFANAPTTRAPAGVPAAISSFANAPTGLASPVPPAVSSFADAPTGLAPSPGGPALAGPPVASNFSEVPTTLDSLRSPPLPGMTQAPARGPAQSAMQGGSAATGSGAVSSFAAGVGLGTAPGPRAGHAAHAAHGGHAAPPTGLGSAATNGNSGAHPWPQPLPARPHVSSASPPVQPSSGYPVMSAEMSAQIATGATVFPSESRGQGNASRGAEPGAPSPGLGGAPGSGTTSDRFPPLPGSDAPASRDSHGHLPELSRAANAVSPVGPGYPDARPEPKADPLDWAIAAGSRGKAVPPWLLAALFIGAIAVALILTVTIARLVR
jgi:serine/threonine-protein kinase